MIGPPAKNSYASFYANYVSLVPENAVLPVLEQQNQSLQAVATSVIAERETFRYAPGKWTIREVVGHMGDAERVFGYRAFAIGRGSREPLPGFDENTFVASAGFNQRSLTTLVEEFIKVRDANLEFLRSLEAGAWDQVGIANGSPVSVLALAYILAGHVRHHLRVLRDRYGVPTAA